ncbi:uncharacterized protein MYCFIDRAFT_203027 [Pseudocercospora fijiensis CIRAD86]|uniref:Uncharacterized protein n=1 Tax=Pseudocercospora fijiensis (strain CIRAD86) TaxID=383855 RepID=M3B503_PSEFD|nr:uncharacterized protein MYCFIDRAFT_203027 [Pseudocercospora fijiensis CIRAD86]EME84453.1 hypothetical protein MYCFIDRAFT_203027 [Pseudocercospora fijiensis CIRAD86]
MMIGREVIYLPPDLVCGQTGKSQKVPLRVKFQTNYHTRAAINDRPYRLFLALMLQIIQLLCPAVSKSERVLNRLWPLEDPAAFVLSHRRPDEAEHDAVPEE